MANRLYIGNLSSHTTSGQIRELFSQAGEVQEAYLIMDRATGRNKGFGFVEMQTEEGAKEAIRRFNGYLLDERALTVDEARPRESRSNGNRDRL